jgi:hypothetical protein
VDGQGRQLDTVVDMLAHGVLTRYRVQRKRTAIQPGNVSKLPTSDGYCDTDDRL